MGNLHELIIEISMFGLINAKFGAKKQNHVQTQVAWPKIANF